MSPEDPRHGTNAGHRAHYEPGGDKRPCEPCKRAHAEYQRRRRARLYLARTDSLTVDATGTRRRIQALQAIGWPLHLIAAACGYDPTPAFMHNVTRKDRVRLSTAQKVAAAYERLSGTPGPSARARARAARVGYAPPLAWDDIDDPNERPEGLRRDWHSGPGHKEIDFAVVDRVLAGENLPTTSAERAEICRRWVASGGSLRQLEKRLGWKPDRYFQVGEEGAA